MSGENIPECLKHEHPTTNRQASSCTEFPLQKTVQHRYSKLMPNPDNDSLFSCWFYCLVVSTNMSDDQLGCTMLSAWLNQTTGDQEHIELEKQLAALESWR